MSAESRVERSVAMATPGDAHMKREDEEEIQADIGETGKQKGEKRIAAVATRATCGAAEIIEE